MDLNEEDRAALLAQASPDIREQVERLLAQPAGSKLLDWSVGEHETAVPSAVVAPGTRVGQYQIESSIGAGGMGVVYRALDTKLNRPVAVKFLSDELADAAARRRFQREAQTASSLNHPHIITVYDAGEYEAQQYLVTEFVDGGTLRNWTSAERRDWRQIVELLVGMADGLATAHEAGILHRDVKPENILISRSGYAKLADFGLAKLADGTPGGDATRTLTEHGTRPGVAVGTIAYMSPEQATGKPLDARTDIFSFGVVLYEALSGRRPFAGANDLELLQTIIHGSPQPLPPEVAASLRNVVEKALEKNPGNRYQSMRDMVVDLRRLLRSSAETATPPKTRGLSHWKWAAAVAALLVAGGTARKFWPRTGPSPIRSLAVLPLRNLSPDPDQEYFADGMTDALTTDLAKIGSVSVIASSSATRYQGTKKTTPEIARELHVDAVVEGSLQRSGNRVRIAAELIDGSSDRHLWGNSYERDVRDAFALQAEVAQAIATEIEGKLTPREQARLTPPRPVNPEAQEAYLRGIYWRQKGDSRKTFESFQQATEKDPTYADAWAELAIAYGLLVDANLMPEQEAYLKERAAVTRALQLDDMSADAHAAWAGVLEYHDFNWTEADREFGRALQLNPNIVLAHAAHSEGLEARGRFDEALAEIRRARELGPYDAIANFGLLEALFYARRYDQLIEEVQKVDEIFPNLGRGLMALAYQMKGDSQHALPPMEGRLKAFPTVPSFLADLANAYAVFGNRQEALRLLAELTDMAKRRHVAPIAFAYVYAGLGDKDKTFQWLGNAMDENPGSVFFLKVDPRFDLLHSDPRFRELLLRMGLPQ